MVAIDTLQVGDQVLAYDSASGQVHAEPVQHVFVNHDDNLLDVTLASDTSAGTAPHSAPTEAAKQHDAAVASHGSQAPPSTATTETVHTTTEHPFLTADRGFVAAQLLVPGEHVRKLDGSLGTVVSLRHVAGVAVRYNLTVGVEHSFVVGVGRYVVHNTEGQACTITDRDLYRSGNSTSPKLDNVREGKDIPAGADMARNTDVVQIAKADGSFETRAMGQSTFANLAPGKNIWRLPAGTNLGDMGLRALNDQGEHWAIQPMENLSREAYQWALEQANRLFEKTWE